MISSNSADPILALKSGQAVGGLLECLASESAELRFRAAWLLREIKCREAIDHLLPWLSQTEAWPFSAEKTCDWVYIAVLEILTHHAQDPGIELQKLTHEPAVVGPWSKK
jgi:HEAT repeat protein